MLLWFGPALVWHREDYRDTDPLDEALLPGAQHLQTVPVVLFGLHDRLQPWDATISLVPSLLVSGSKARLEVVMAALLSLWILVPGRSWLRSEFGHLIRITRAEYFLIHVDIILRGGAGVIIWSNFLHGVVHFPRDLHLIICAFKACHHKRRVLLAISTTHFTRVYPQRHFSRQS